MCERPDFDRAQNTATKLLLQQNLDSLFIDIESFTFDRKIHIDSVQNYANVVQCSLYDFVCDEFSGCCVIPSPRCNLVLFDDWESNPRRKHWGIAHEIGHIYLGHSEDGEKEEKEANYFAAQIVAPEIVLCEIRNRNGSICADDLLDHFNISHEAATKRISTLNRRCCYNNSDIDRLLLSKFYPILDRELSTHHPQRRNYGFPIDWSDEIGAGGRARA